MILPFWEYTEKFASNNEYPGSSGD